MWQDADAGEEVNFQSFASGGAEGAEGPSPSAGASDMLIGMDQHVTALERAFQLAKSGQVEGVADIIAALKQEGYRIDQMQGPQLFAQLRRLIGAARAPEAPKAGAAPPT